LITLEKRMVLGRP